jgi:hypothetical protein
MSILVLLCAIAGLILITLFTEKGELGWSVFVFLAFLAVIFFIDKSWSFDEFKTYLADNTGYIISGAIVYVLIGILWAIMKWKWFCRDKYASYANRSYEPSTIFASEHKARITGWMVWWPFSMGWFLLHDPITRFYNYLYTRLSRMFDSISNAEKAKAIKPKQ